MSQTLEEKIKELERQLSVKNAYLALQFSFGKTKLPEDVKEEVLAKLKEVCESLAKGMEVIPDKATSIFDDSEISILKSLIETVKNRKQTTVKETEAVKTAPTAPSVKKAMIISSESLDRRMKAKIDYAAPVSVIKEQEGTALVATNNGLQFAISSDCLEYLE